MYQKIVDTGIYELDMPGRCCLEAYIFYGMVSRGQG